MPPKGTLKTIRNILTSIHSFEEKHLTKSRFMLNNSVDMNDHPCREMGRGEKGTGWCFEVNSIITTICGGGGGRKGISYLCNSFC